MLPNEAELLEGIRHACLYYLSKSYSSESPCDLTMEKLIANEVPFRERERERVRSPRLNGMSLVIEYKRCFQ